MKKEGVEAMKVLIVLILICGVLSIIFGFTLKYGLSQIDFAERLSSTIPHDYFFWKTAAGRIAFHFYLWSFLTVAFFFVYLYERIKREKLKRES